MTVIKSSEPQKSPLFCGKGINTTIETVRQLMREMGLASDVAFFRFNDRYYCVCVIMDLYARKIISYCVGTDNSTQLVKSASREAYESRKPEKGLIFHSDHMTTPWRNRSFPP